MVWDRTRSSPSNSGVGPVRYHVLFETGFFGYSIQFLPVGYFPNWVDSIAFIRKLNDASSLPRRWRAVFLRSP